jgi:hypothetical protein
MEREIACPRCGGHIRLTIDVNEVRVVDGRQHVTLHEETAVQPAHLRWNPDPPEEHEHQGKLGRPGLDGLVGKDGLAGTYYMVKTGRRSEDDSKPIYPEYVEVRDGKWVPDGRNWKRIDEI